MVVIMFELDYIDEHGDMEAIQTTDFGTAVRFINEHPTACGSVMLIEREG